MSTSPRLAAHLERLRAAALAAFARRSGLSLSAEGAAALVAPRGLARAVELVAFAARFPSPLDQLVLALLLRHRRR